MNRNKLRVRWAAWGDLNAFFGLTLDNLTNLVLLWGLLAAANFPQDVYFKYMVPGTALGVLFGDLVYTWMAIRLGRRTGRSDVTAMPLGLDTPSTIGVALAVIIPVFQAALSKGASNHDAALAAWKVGMATMVFMGLLKTLLSFAGGRIQKLVPRAGLIGSLAAVGITLLGYIPVINMFGAPVAGLLSLGLVVYALAAGHRLPFGLPGAFAAVLVGTLAYYAVGLSGLGPAVPAVSPTLALALPLPTLGFLDELGPALAYLPFAIPFGLLTIVGGINVTESARCAGDDYPTGQILLTEAVATLLAGLFGGVVQSTPYIGHPAYKRMGARAAYTLATGLAVGLGGFLGLVGWVVEVIPAAAVAPLLFFVGMEITVQAFKVTPQRHYAAVFLAFPPALAELCRIMLSTTLFDPGLQGAWPTSPGAILNFQVACLLGHGFILTSMLWASVAACLSDGNMRRAAVHLLVMAGLTFFGFMHSVKPFGDVYLPWNLPEATMVYTLAATYLGLALVLALVKNRPPVDNAPA